MKCQKCEKPATFHITDLTGDELLELHLCAECGKHYLQPAQAPLAAPTLSGVFEQQLKIEQTAEDLKELDSKTCPICGISFFQFRQEGRLGCPHDYIYFAEELEPLLTSVHGNNSHVGKKPKRGVQDTESQTELIRLRREMKDAIKQEDYEQASQLRDQIRTVEGEGQ